MIRRARRLAAVTAVLGALAGCPQCMPEQVGEDVARLTVRNLQGMLLVLDDDDRCGFASAAVRAAADVEGTPGSAGSVTTTVNACTLDLGDGRDIFEDCNGVPLPGFVRVTVSATRTITGTLTGDPDDPVVPSSSDAVTVEITEARLDDFRVTRSDSDLSLRMTDGSIAAEASPVLAAAASTGLCTIATPNITFRNIRYDDANVRVFEDDWEYDADITESNVRAQLGRSGASENSIGGTMTVYESDVDISGNDELEDDYDRETFIEGYACSEDISDPVSFECEDLAATAADTAARFGFDALAAIAAALEQDTACGFASAGAAAAVEIVGAPGTEGTVTVPIIACALEFDEGFAGPPDCTGRQQTLSGTVVATGARLTRGLITGDPAMPVIPLSSQPSTYSLELTFSDLAAGNTITDDALRIRSGSVEATIRPMVYVGSDTGVCTVATPNVDFDDVNWSDVELEVRSSAGTTTIDVDSSALSATRGVTAAGTNLLDGTVTAGGTVYEVDASGRGLDPAFNATSFASSWQCLDTLAEPLSSECRAAGRTLIGDDAARLTMQTLGIALRAIENDTACGFSSAGVVDGASIVAGPGGVATATYALPSNGCTITAPVQTTLFVDCLGATTSMSGAMTVTGTRTVTGAPTADPTSPILPLSTDAIRYELTFTFDALSFQKAGMPVGLSIVDGAVDAVIAPRLALNPATGACTIATPIATFEDVTWSDASVTLLGAGATVHTAITLDGSSLAAQAGSGVATQNTLQGSVSLLGGSLTVDGALDPAFDPMVFAATWACAANGSPALVDDAQCALAAGE